ncbi:MAG: hypothetical protein NBV67_18685 [Tagaea sp.]|nr:hypothetical protein [Tagaea sp.]
MSGSLTSPRFGPLAALAALTALGVWAAASQLPPSRADDPTLARAYAMDFGKNIELAPMPGHPDASIVESLIRRRNYEEPFFSWSEEDVERYDRSRIHLTRFRIAPGGEPQIVMALVDRDFCTAFFGCPGAVLTKQGPHWVTLTTFDSPSGVHFTVATRPFWARPTIEGGPGIQELEYGRRVLVQPAKAGRPTFVGRTSAVFWDGTEWQVGCWQRCESR